MITEIQPGIIWNDEIALLQEQQPEVQALVSDVLSTPVLRREYEVCLSNKRRTTLKVYKLNNSYNLIENIIYNAGPDSKEFMGVADFTYSIIAA